MNMQQLMMQAQKMQRELRKAKDALATTLFTKNRGGMVEVKMYGNFTIESINIDADAFDADNKEMVEETITICINELIAEIRKAEEDINNKITGSPNGGGLF